MRIALFILCMLILPATAAAQALRYGDWMLEAQSIFLEAGAASSRIDQAMTRLETVKDGAIPVDTATREALAVYFDVEGDIGTVAMRVDRLAEVETEVESYRIHAADLTVQLRRLPTILDEEREVLRAASDAVAEADWATFDSLAIRAIGQSARWLLIENLILEGALDRLMADHPQYALNQAIIAENRAVIRVIEFYTAVATNEEADPAVYAATVEGFLASAQQAVDRGRQAAGAVAREFDAMRLETALPGALIDRAIASIATYETSFDTEERIIAAIRESLGPAPEVVSLAGDAGALLTELRQLEARFYGLVIERLDQQTARYRYLERSLDDQATELPE